MRASKKALVVTYYWPPDGGSGVQRWLKLCKYLPLSGWVPVVFVTKSHVFRIRDESLVGQVDSRCEVVRNRVPHILARLIKASEWYWVGGRRKKSDRWRLVDFITRWLRVNFLLPDPKVLLVRGAFRRLNAIIREHKIGVVITTGPPHSTHLIGRSLKRKWGKSLCWVADFRDPWAGYDAFQALDPSQRVQQRHAELEKSVLTQADHVLTVSPTWLADLRRAGATKASLLPNGYDHEDFDAKSPPLSRDNESFRLFYAGVLDELRNPVAFWEVLGELMVENREFGKRLRVFICGIVSAGVAARLKRMFGSRVQLEPYLPHNQVIPHYFASDLLLLATSNYPGTEGHIPAKFFEYAASGTRVLALVSPRSDVARIMDECGIGVVVEKDDRGNMKRVLLESFQHPFSRKKRDDRWKHFEQYRRAFLANKMGVLLDRIAPAPQGSEK